MGLPSEGSESAVGRVRSVVHLVTVPRSRSCLDQRLPPAFFFGVILIPFFEVEAVNFFGAKMPIVQPSPAGFESKRAKSRAAASALPQAMSALRPAVYNPSWRWCAAAYRRASTSNFSSSA